jgi:hypothetical protein
MTRRELLTRLVDAGRLSLLRLRLQLGRPLPAIAVALLAWLDRQAVRTQRGGGR